MKRPLGPKNARGFTLVELLVAMAISTIIVGVLVTITGVATDTWTRSRSEIRASRQAKVMLDTMAKDFESLVSRSGNQYEWLYSKIDTDADLPAVARSQGAGAEVAEITMLTAATDRYLGQIGTTADQGGDVSCVSYRMRFNDPITANSRDEETKTFVLYRLLLNPDETYTDLLGQEDLDSAFQPFEARVTEEENFICENVIQFTVSYLVEVIAGTENNKKREIARLPLGGSVSSGEFRLKGTGIETGLTASGYTKEQIEAGRLTGVELSISVISDAGLARMTAAETGLTDEDYARQVYHYSRVVDVPSM